MARTFNGSTDKIDCGTHTGFGTTTGSYTYSGWIFPTSTANGYQGFFGSYDGGSGAVGLFFNAASSRKLAIYVHNQAAYDGSGSFTLSLNTWYHFAATLVISGGSTTATGYVNGALDGTGVAGSVPTADDFLIGFSSGGGNPFIGSVADVAIWNRALSVTEIAGLAAGIRPHMFPSSLQGYYPLDGLQSPEPDLSGNAFNGTLTGTAALRVGPPFALFTPRWPQFLSAAAAGFTAKYRRTLSPVGTRVGSRQMRLVA